MMPLLDSADLRIINLEALDRQRAAVDPHAQASAFQAPPSSIETLRAAKIDACSLANNHIVDFEEQGLLDTIVHLDDAGIRHAGAGRDREEASAPAVLSGRGSVGSGSGFGSWTICRLSRRETGLARTTCRSPQPDVLP